MKTTTPFLLLWLAVTCMEAQGPAALADSCSYFVSGTSRIRYTDLGRIRTVLNDGTAKKDCMIREIRRLHVVYEKNRALHDMMKDKILRMEIQGSNRALVFSTNGSPNLIYIESDE